MNINRSIIACLIPMSVVGLPFTKALTLNVGFPLKIYEMILLLCLFFSLLSLRWSFPRSIKGLIQIQSIFLLAISLSTFTAIIFPSTGFSTEVNGRFGPSGDAFTKLAYIFFCFGSYFLFIRYTIRSPDIFYKSWMMGALACTAYTWYLFFCPLIGCEPLLLPGIDNLQHFNFAGIKYIRSGTFEEGNFLGLYLLLSLVMATYNRNNMLASFFGITIFIIFSTANIIALAFFMILLFKEKTCDLALFSKLKYIVICFFFFTIGIYFLNTFSYLDQVIIQKFTSSSSSGMDRLDQIISGTRMFINNPFGVGLGQYGYYYKYYQFTDQFEIFHPGKMIANNVYVELLSETGFIGLILFMSFFVFLLNRLLNIRDRKIKVLIYGIYSLLIVFFAYPSYIAIFIWAFLAYVTAQYCIKSSSEREPFCPKYS